MVSDVDDSSWLSVDGVWAQPQSDTALIASKIPSVGMEDAPNRGWEEEVKGRAIIVLSLLRSKVRLRELKLPGFRFQPVEAMPGNS